MQVWYGMKMNCEEKIKKCFFNYYNRANYTPMHTSAIQRKLENEYTTWKVVETLKKMEEGNILRSMKIKSRYAGETRFYFPRKIVTNYDDEQRMIKKIKNIIIHIERYSKPMIAGVLGKHLHALVRYELRAQGFIIISEETNEYEKRKWKDTKQDIDIIAKHVKKQLVVGVEIKNELDLMDKTEIDAKIKICKRLGIIPVFACRWLEPYRQEIKNNDGFAWQFKTQLYPLGFERHVKHMKQKFDYPVKIATEIPKKAIKEFEKWLETK